VDDWIDESWEEISESSVCMADCVEAIPEMMSSTFVKPVAIEPERAVRLVWTPEKPEVTSPERP
jgi:hypothetical protein